MGEGESFEGTIKEVNAMNKLLVSFRKRFFVALVIIIVAHFEVNAAEVEGSIDSPSDGDKVAGVYEAKGSVSNLPSGHKLWVVVRKGKNFWPKDEAFVVGGKKWTANVDESATKPGRPYSLVLFSVGPSGQTQIADWKRISEETHSWPAMKGIKDSNALDMVDLRRK